MSETVPVAAPAVSAPGTKASAKKPKKAAASSKARKPPGPSVTELITKAVSASKERKGVSLAALKKALAAGGYDVEKSNSRIKVGLKSLVSKGTLVQTKGTGASGSFKLSKKPEPAAKPKKPVAKKPASAAKKPKKAAAVKKSPKKVKKPVAAAAKKAAKSPKKVKAAKPKKAAKSPAKAKAVKPKVAKPKPTKPKVAKAKKAAPKKK
ncbi:histone cluster 1, H1t [Chelydra serpentina]|uniref:Histone cluster 1, H1t n=1 Tax=Chelydra serpentina TaxID=8475 RepID=A0A8T1S7C1_CHESE|nr:histone cluster 1, H1t [Chelydra serpentina]